MTTEYQNPRLTQGASGLWMLIETTPEGWTRITPLDNLRREQLPILHRLTGGDCGDESCKCWARGRDRGVEDQQENGRPLWAQ